MVLTEERKMNKRMIRCILFVLGFALCLTGCKPSADYAEIGQTLLEDVPGLVFA
jgi:ABC-type oligopeptide transport system substrate-binding subunit